LIKSLLVYSVLYLNLEWRSPPLLACGDKTGLNFSYAVIIKILIKSYKSRKVEQSTVNN